MIRWFSPALLAVALTFGGPTAIKSAAAAPVQVAAQKPATSTDISARRYYRHYHHRHYYHYGYRYRPYYYARPYYYRPYPYYVAPYYAPAPFPFVFGFGLGPWWW
ncbi:hypothetical protein [Bradyrhizobium sp.]|uniref:hypothetical protein n=1 Tax=Bradyrhizobium sp. TaxID=376 RepID=UPI003C71E980